MKNFSLFVHLTICKGSYAPCPDPPPLKFISQGLGIDSKNNTTHALHREIGMPRRSSPIARTACTIILCILFFKTVNDSQNIHSIALYVFFFSMHMVLMCAWFYYLRLTSFQLSEQATDKCVEISTLCWGPSPCNVSYVVYLHVLTQVVYVWKAAV